MLSGPESCILRPRRTAEFTELHAFCSAPKLLLCPRSGLHSVERLRKKLCPVPSFIRKLLHVPGLTEEGAVGPFSSCSRWDPVLCSGPQAVAGEWGAGWGSGGSTLSGAVGL